MTAPKRILHVEDDEVNRKIVRDLLTANGFAVFEAVDGAEGVRLAAEILPDLILMDIQLPVLNGHEATRRIKSRPELAKIPLFVLTSYALSGDREEAIAAGADDYLAKPYDPSELLRRIVQRLG